jgi:hypothetical protein
VRIGTHASSRGWENWSTPAGAPIGASLEHSVAVVYALGAGHPKRSRVSFAVVTFLRGMTYL